MNRHQIASKILIFYRVGKNRGGHHRKPRLLKTREEEWQEALNLTDEILKEA